MFHQFPSNPGTCKKLDEKVTDLRSMKRGVDDRGRHHQADVKTPHHRKQVDFIHFGSTHQSKSIYQSIFTSII
jgi:hypothetical protein